MGTIWEQKMAMSANTKDQSVVKKETPEKKFYKTFEWGVVLLRGPNTASSK